MEAMQRNVSTKNNSTSIRLPKKISKFESINFMDLLVPLEPSN